MAFTGIQAQDVAAGLLESLSSVKVEDQQHEQLSCVRISGSGQSLSVERILSHMPKRKLSMADFVNVALMEMKEKADHEASLPPESVALICRAELMSTLVATWELLRRTYRDEDHPRVQVLIDRPRVYSSTKMKNLARSTYIRAY